MKNTLSTFIVAIFLLIGIQSLKSQTVSIATDQRAELVSIVGRLAKFPEYSRGRIKAYNEDIDIYFSEYTSHPVIHLAQEYRKEYGVSYDAMMWVALHINISNSDVLINPYAYNNLPGRWSKERLETFVSGLSDFYKKTGFNEFYNAHLALYKHFEEEMTDILKNKTYFSWFDDFWGTQSTNTFHVIVSVANGCGNYGLKIVDDNKDEEIYAVIGVCELDDMNNPVFNTEYLIPLFVHEINHSYEKGVKEITRMTQAAGEIILPPISNLMAGQAYTGWQTIVEEAMVRAGVINYMENDPVNLFNVDREIRIQKGRGFFWIDKLAEQFRIYQQNRDKYPMITDFTQPIIEIYQELATKMAVPGFKFPHVTGASIENNATVPAGKYDMIFIFNRPMVGRGYGFNPGNLGENSFPKIEKGEWISDKSIKITLDLESRKEYSICLYTPAYLDQEGFPVLENFNIQFKTD